MNGELHNNAHAAAASNNFLELVFIIISTWVTRFLSALDHFGFHDSRAEKEEVGVGEDLHQQGRDDPNFMSRIISVKERLRDQTVFIVQESTGCKTDEGSSGQEWNLQHPRLFAALSSMNLSTKLRLLTPSTSVFFWGIWRETFRENNLNFGAVVTGLSNMTSHALSMH